MAEFARAAAQQIRAWVAVEVGPGRLFPWLPIAYGLGIVLYFTADHEPIGWAACGLSAGSIAAVFLARRHAVALVLLMGAAAAAAGFATATLKAALLAHPILQRPAYDVRLTGFVETREELERSDRIVVRAQEIEGARLEQRPERVRLSVRRGKAPPVGTFVALKARLRPPLEPLRPGGYEYARGLYFQQIGASGVVLGAIKSANAPVPASGWLRYASAIAGLRDAIDSRIRAVLPGDVGSIASAVITGKRDALTAPVNDAMYVSSLAHVLSISGYHMAVVAGIVFFVIRAGLALVPAIALRYPIKKWAALAAFAAAAFYLLLSGAEVATQRSFIMIGIVLIGVMADRRALTFRTIALAALAVLLLAPEAVVHPSFQMSFAATLALISLYQGGLPWMRPEKETSLGARMALWGGREVVSLILASLVAGLATTPYAAYHFHRLAPYGVVANLLAMPIVSAWVMPAGIAGVLAMPFGFDGFFWRLMGSGLDWMIAVAAFVAGLPGAVGRIAAFGPGPLLLGTAGLIIVCLLKTPLRWCGAALMIGASLWALAWPQPDILVAPDGQTFAIRGRDGRLAAIRTGADNFALRDWLGADADARTGSEPDLHTGIACDEAGCVGRLADGGIVAIALSAEAFDEDCRRAVLVLSPREAPADCAAAVVDRKAWRAHGAIALRRVEHRFEARAVRPAGYDRPWAPAAREQGQAAASGELVRSPAAPHDIPAPDADLETVD
ncbi:MAG: ComEC/Rec2 family competence protein [Xanthobacteraceae bacterium]